jgi:hypothetical protein
VSEPIGGAPGGRPARDVRAVVVTTVQAPTPAMVDLAAGCVRRGVDLVVVGDRRTPAGFALPGSRYYDLDRQAVAEPRLAGRLPIGHYARKNLGYLLAIQAGAEVILETDDDNVPGEGFWADALPDVVAPTSAHHGWLNTYRYFTGEDGDIWPRGFPWRERERSVPELTQLPQRAVHCPVQQGLTDGDPDVDALWRLTRNRRVRFVRGRRIALGPGSWCPFNSQNTRWFRPAFPLLYLPASCSGRLTDIWRSFVAQRVLWERGGHVLFHEATARHERNAHDPAADIDAEWAGYVHNWELVRRLSDLSLPPGSLGDAMVRCYETLVAMRLLAGVELAGLDAWLTALA